MGNTARASHAFFTPLTQMGRVKLHVRVGKTSFHLNHHSDAIVFYHCHDCSCSNSPSSGLFVEPTIIRSLPYRNPTVAWHKDEAPESCLRGVRRGAEPSRRRDIHVDGRHGAAAQRRGAGAVGDRQVHRGRAGPPAEATRVSQSIESHRIRLNQKDSNWI